MRMYNRLWSDLKKIKTVQYKHEDLLVIPLSKERPHSSSVMGKQTGILLAQWGYNSGEADSVLTCQSSLKPRLTLVVCSEALRV